MKILIAKESIGGECRVSGTPSSVAKLIKLGYEVLVEAGVLLKPVLMAYR